MKTNTISVISARIRSVYIPTREPHLALVKQILCYVKGTLDAGLSLGAGPVDTLTTYSDADWAGCPDS